MTAVAGSWKMSLARQASKAVAGNVTSCNAPNISECSLAYDAKTHLVLLQIMLTIR